MSSNSTVLSNVRKIKADIKERLSSIEKPNNRGKIIFPENVKGFVKVDLLGIEIIEQAYKNRNSRKKSIKYLGLDLKYINNQSTDLWAHYEDNKNILVAFHGASNIELNILSLKTAVKGKATQESLKKGCEKYTKMVNNKKNVIFFGHSLGGFIINRCQDTQNNPINGIVYGSYQVRRNDEWATRNNIRKHFYENDFLANTLLKSEKIKNLNVYKKQGKFTIKGTNTHGLFNYKANKVITLNKELITHKK
tara:strand:+ start:83 stop:832 length:750 start_codon:yes stop_codon:yes gene_type:complete